MVEFVLLDATLTRAYMGKSFNAKVKQKQT